jgi:hypothetical protein
MRNASHQRKGAIQRHSVFTALRDTRRLRKEADDTDPPAL